MTTTAPQEENLNTLFLELLEACQPRHTGVSRMLKVRQVLERLCKEVLGPQPKKGFLTLEQRVKALCRACFIKGEAENKLHFARRLANKAVHDNVVPSLDDQTDSIWTLARTIAQCTREPLPQAQFDLALNELAAVAAQAAAIAGGAALPTAADDLTGAANPNQALLDAEEAPLPRIIPIESAVTELAEPEAQLVPASNEVLPLHVAEEGGSLPVEETGLTLPPAQAGNRYLHFFDARRMAARVTLVHKDLEARQLHCSQEDDLPDEPLLILQYGQEGINEGFDITFALAQPGDELAITEPVPLPNGHLAPRFTALFPDYLISTTTVSECVGIKGSNMEMAFLKLLSPRSSSLAMLKGNLINAGLDAIIKHYARTQEDFPAEQWVRRELFKQAPLELTLRLPTNEEAKQFLNGIKQQLDQLSQAVKLGLLTKQAHEAATQNRQLQERINPSGCLLEPSFFSARFGLQGRMDVFFDPGLSTGKPSQQFHVIELKSGKVNNWGPSPSHRAQANLYRLLVPFTPQGGPLAQGNVKLLYSAHPSLREMVYPVTMMGTNRTGAHETIDRLLDLRNQIAWFELQLSQAASANEVLDLLRLLLGFKLPCSNGKVMQENNPVFQDAFRAVVTTIKGARPQVRDYVFEFLRFVLAEKRLMKVGQTESSRGVAAMWRNSLMEKAASHSIIDELEIASIDIAAGQLTLVRRRSQQLFEENVGRLSADNFRMGDMMALYPRRAKGATGQTDLGPMDNQLLRCNLGSRHTDEQGHEYLTVNLMSQYISEEYLAQFSHWALEADSLDSNAEKQASALVDLFAAAPDKQDLLLGLRKPRFDERVLYAHDEFDTATSTEHQALLNRAVQALDYFLLVGPPGTGKTRCVLRNLVRHLYMNTGENLLLISYTNRAIDEICEQLEELARLIGGFDYVRIGQHQSCDPKYAPRLLSQRMQNLHSRADITSMLNGCRVFVGTCFSLMGKPELFELKSFRTAIIDEGSQILEPQIISLLLKVERFIMIGDDKQLPAVVVQDPETSALVEDSPLRELGFDNLRSSLFERLKRRAQAMEWHSAWGTIKRQGRLHRDLLPFVNQHFYNSQLELAGIPRQEAPFAPPVTEGPFSALLQQVAGNRLVYVGSTYGGGGGKLHAQEARVAALLVGAIWQRYGSRRKTDELDGFDPNTSVGVIAPFRNQVGRIKKEIAALATRLGPDAACLNEVRVDTVERFQGSQCEVMILSLCINSINEFNQLSVVTQVDGQEIDRKLNVALTRGKEQLFVLGTARLMVTNPIYKKLLAWLREAGLELSAVNLLELEPAVVE